MKQLMGKIGEDEASEFLKKKGFSILEKNFRSRFGEIDIICKKGDLIVFVEVKMRNSNFYGTGFEAITSSKKNKLIKTAEYFILKYKKDCLYRFDVISIDNGNIVHIENAFQIE
ncbi:MAG: YraN family protein [Deferribacterales bacterium]